MHQTFGSWENTGAVPIRRLDKFTAECFFLTMRVSFKARLSSIFRPSGLAVKEGRIRNSVTRQRDCDKNIEFSYFLVGYKIFEPTVLGGNFIFR